MTADPGDGNDEVSLDIEMAISMAPGLASVIVYEGSTTDDILNRMATDNLAKQLSASWTYGIDAGSDQIFLEFAAQGQSFFNASGDGDAYVGSLYPPAPPTDDPNITSVGGTTLTTSGPGGAWVSETVWNWDVEYVPYDDGIGSSGGISITYPIPSWQAGVSMTANHGSTTFRNIPDVALTADNVFVVFDNGADREFWRHKLRDAVVGGLRCLGQRASCGQRPSDAWLHQSGHLRARPKRQLYQLFSRHYHGQQHLERKSDQLLRRDGLRSLHRLGNADGEQSGQRFGAPGCIANLASGRFRFQWRGGGAADTGVSKLCIDQRWERGPQLGRRRHRALA